MTIKEKIVVFGSLILIWVAGFTGLMQMWNY